MEFYSAIKKNKIMSSAGKWMELENIMLNEIRQSQKVKGCMFFHMWIAREKIRKKRDFR